ncbi:hypothetical protein HK105_208960 [Polyrhizophydium stewartii]|uniref:BAG domain-containing protein n=1 Tax=Polyrhizophydium stewartii TaxID=2732419 RepID=A0ABR4MWD2_9FUNG
MSLVVTFRGRRHEVLFEDEFEQLGGEWTDLVTLRQLRDRLSAQMGVNADHIKLAHAGVVMLDLDAPLSFFGIDSGSKIMMLVDTRPQDKWGPHQSQPSQQQPSHGHTQQQHPSHQQQPQQHHQPPQPQLTPEQRLIQRLDDQLIHTETVIVPMLEVYQRNVEAFTSPDRADRPQPTLTQKQIKDEHAKITELLLQSLLKVDGVECESDMVDARAKRREAVRFIQGRLDIADALKERFNHSIKELGSL